MGRRGSLGLGLSALFVSAWVVSGCTGKLPEKKEEPNPQNHAALSPEPSPTVTGNPVPDPPASPWESCLSIDPTDGLDFGRVEIGEQAELPVVVVNACEFDVILAQADLGQLSSSAFSLGPTRAAPAFVPKGARQTLTVYFEPSSAGRVEGTLVLNVLWTNSMRAFSTRVPLVGESDLP